MPDLVLGPLLRYVGPTEATVWAETDAPCDVAVLGARGRTFTIEGHHYALIVIEGLAPGTRNEYEVHLDGRCVWPPDDGRPRPAIVTPDGTGRARLAFGSCRAGAPHRRPYTLSPTTHPHGFGIDALWAYSNGLQTGHEPWPDCLLLLGDQVYADELSPAVEEYVKGRDGEAGDEPGGPPRGEIADFEEYTLLHRETWSDPDIRWLLSTVPSTMIADDHDVHDDWNISASWVRDARALPWWDGRICGAFMAYWTYQHIGNLAPAELAGDALLAAVREDDDAGPRLRRFARAADRDTTSARFAYHRDFGGTRLVVMDTRAARVLTPGGRSIVDEGEWDWIRDTTAGTFDHLLLASTLPVFMAHGIHHAEAWSERVCDGVWGRPAAWVGERVRRGLDFDHWPSFGTSFRAMVGLLGERSAPAGDGAEPPATILLLGGDVHTAYVAEVRLGRRQRSRIHQLVCSPFRKPLTARERRAVRILFSRPAGRVARTLARAARVPQAEATWRVTAGPTFHNSIGVLDLDGRRARLTIRRSDAPGAPPGELAPLHLVDLTE